MSLQPPSDREEQSALASERSHPAQLRQPALDQPVVRRAREEILRPALSGVEGLVFQHRAWIGPQVLDALVGEPALHFGERVPVLFGMLILIAQPRLAALGLGAPIP